MRGVVHGAVWCTVWCTMVRGVTQIKRVDPAQERRVREDVMKALDQKENEFLPQVSLNITEVGGGHAPLYPLSSGIAGGCGGCEQHRVTPDIAG